MLLLGGRLYISCTPIKGAGAWTLVPFSYASDSGATRICHREAKARERSDQAGGGWEGVSLDPPTVGRFFANSCMKTAFSRTLKAIIKGSLCDGRGIDQFPPLFLFLLNLSQIFVFFFLSFLSVFLFFLFFPPFFFLSFFPLGSPFLSFFSSFSPFLVSGPSGGGGHSSPLAPPPPP